jgi:acetyl-CoA/propionyl-CoA carboxylase biotin carboxyl carrier protein
VRVDSGVGAFGEVSPMYDPMVAKLIVWDADRAQATARMLRALAEYEIEGLKTLIPFHTKLLSSEDWAQASTCRDLLEDKEWLKTLAFEKPAPVDDDAPEKATKTYEVEVSGKRFDVRVTGEAFAAAAVNGAGPASAPKKRGERKSGAAGGPDLVESPLQGNMWKVLVKKGDSVDEGQLLCIIEAMKMENEITAPKAGVVEELHVAEGEPIAAGAPIAKIVAAVAA